mgnify:CR=1 FL=1
MSHPAWVCGLKQSIIAQMHPTQCHTLRGCVDWNLPVALKLSLLGVTPCVGVWIETDKHPYVTEAHPGHTLRGCVDWNYEDFVIPSLSDVTPCVGVWIETFYSRKSNNVLYSHTLRGCVDWNTTRLYFALYWWSHPAWVCGLKPITRVL